MRQELNQIRWQTNQHNIRAYLGLAVVLALYMVVGYLENVA